MSVSDNFRDGIYEFEFRFLSMEGMLHSFLPNRSKAYIHININPNNFEITPWKKHFKITRLLVLGAGPGAHQSPVMKQDSYESETELCGAFKVVG